MSRGVQVGVNNLHYAVLTKDDATGVTYDAPVAVPGVISIDVKTNGNIDSLYADDAPFATAAALGDIEVSLNMAQLDLVTIAALLGHTVNAGVVDYKSTDTPPDVALLFESKKNNGSKKFVKILKGKFQEPEENFQTKTNNIQWNTPKLTGKFVTREFDRAWKRVADEDAEGYVKDTGDKWYDGVEPAAPAGGGTKTGSGS
jgi:phi13 family phage major tail protein